MWNYAIRFVIGVVCQKTSLKFDWNDIKQHVRDRKIYIQLWKRHLAELNNFNWVSKLSREDKIILSKIEERLPFDNIIVFRSISRAVLKVELQKKEIILIKNAEKKSSSNWWNYFFSSSLNESFDESIFQFI